MTLEFDELNVLTTNREYILSTLQLEGIDIEFSEKASEKTQEECKPGTPFIVFRVDPSINLTFVNDQPHTGKSLHKYNRSMKRKKFYDVSTVCIHLYLYPLQFYRTFHNHMPDNGKRHLQKDCPPLVSNGEKCQRRKKSQIIEVCGFQSRAAENAIL